MTDPAFARSARLIGQPAMDRIAAAHVWVVGLGGVGGQVVEALARTGVGRLTLVDGDVVDITNLNRQVLYTRAQVGLPKASCARERVLSIAPDCAVVAQNAFYGAGSPLAAKLTAEPPDFVVDAIDDLPAKIDLICRCQGAGIPIISAMGAGNKLDPMGFAVMDLFQTSYDPLARVLRRELKKRGVSRLTVAASREIPQTVPADEQGGRAPASIAFVPPAMGLLIAGHVLKTLGGIEKGGSHGR